MNERFSWGIKFVIVYALLCMVAFIIVICPKANDGLSWLYIMALTFPWSYIEAILLLLFNMSDAITEATRLLSLAFFAAVNAAFVYYLGNKAQRNYRRGKQRKSKS